MNLFVFSALFFPVIISGLSVVFFRTSDKLLKLLTAFSGAYLLTLCCIEILPEIYSGDNARTTGVFVLVGFFIQLLLDFLSRGVEHGHAHHGTHGEGEKDVKHVPVAPVMIGLCIHSFLEAMPLADTFGMTHMRDNLITGIIIHNIPISIVLMSLLLHRPGSRKSTAIILLGVFAITAPLGTLLSHFIGINIVENISIYFNFILAVVVGIFLHIATTILFEADSQHRFNLLKFVVIIIGGITAYFLA